MPCPPEIPQAVCAAIDAVLTTQPPVKPPDAPPWGSGDIAVTLQQWVAAMSKTSPVPPSLPSTPADLATNQYATLLGAAVDFWKNVGGRAPEATTKIDPRTWQLPWQYGSPTATNVPDAIGTMLAGALQDPAAREQILRGQIPTFRPDQMDWGTRSAQPFWGGTNTIPAVSAAGAFVQPLQDFITRGNQCGLFNTTPAAVQQAWADYIAFGVDACSKLQPAPGGDPVKVPLPELPPGDKTTTTAVPAKSNALAIGLAVGGAALLGGLVWALSKRSAPASSYMAEESSAVRRQGLHLRRRVTP